MLGAVAALIAPCLVATPARAQTTDEGPATIDAGRGPLAGSTRFLGMAGAFVAIAQDTEGVSTNPAASALRLPYSWTDWDYGLGGDLSIGAWLPKNDIYQRTEQAAEVKDSTALFGSVAALLYYRHFGFGIAGEAQQNAATRSDQAAGISTSLTASFGMMHASLAHGFFDGQLLLGAGPRLVGVTFDRQRRGGGPLSAGGVGYEAGFIVKPAAQQFRLGASVKSPLYAKIPGESGEASQAVHVPWEVALGAAYQFGAPRLNPRFVTASSVAARAAAGLPYTRAQLRRAEDELYQRYQRAERFYVLVSAELALIQGARGHADFEQYWSRGTLQPIAGVILSPRLGVESEVVPHILRLRGGSYYESAVVGGARGRLHGTFGLDVRLFRWNVFGLRDRFDYWRLTVAADGARQYLNTALSIGFWH